MKINNAGKISAGIPLLMMPASLAFVFALSAIFPELAPSDSSAVATGTALINLTVPDNISIDLSKTELEINISPSGSYANFAEDYTVAEVSTNNFTGYTLVLSDTDSDTNLVRTKVSTEEPDSTIATINTTNNPGYDSSVGIASGDLRSNAWGYSVGSGTAGSYTAGNYFDVPALASPKNIKVTSGAVSSDLTPVFFGTKVDNTMTPGNYQDEVIFTAIANYQPSQNNQITNVAPSSIYVGSSTNQTITIDTNIDYSENLTDATHPLNVYFVKVGSTPESSTACANVSLLNNSDKLRITCTTPGTALEATDYTIRLVFTKLGDLTYNSNDTLSIESTADFWNIVYMQDMSAEICSSVYTPGNTIGTTTYVTNETDYDNNVTAAGTSYIPQRQLIDKRDNKPYYVKKLADGNCWMDQNLDLDLGIASTTPNQANTTMTLTNELTDLNTKTTWTPPYNTQLSTGTAWAENGSEGAKSFTFNDNGTIDVKTGGTDGRYWDGASSYATTGNLRNHFGNYYNWPAATAGSGTADIATDGTNVGDSICPKGWQLPQNSGSKSFNNLIRTVYGITTTTSDASVIAEPLHFIRSAYYYWNGGTLNYQGACGLFWSATAGSGTNAYRLDFNNSNSGSLRPQHSSSRGSGFAVRCVAR